MPYSTTITSVPTALARGMLMVPMIRHTKSPGRFRLLISAAARSLVNCQ